MGDVTLKVPAEHAEDFRRALVKEMEIDIRSVNTNQDSLEEATYRDRLLGSQHAESAAEDVRASLGSLHRDAALMDQVDLTATGECEVSTDDIETLFAACETMAREIVGPQLKDALGTSPIDRSWADERVRPLIARLSWAIDSAAEIDDEMQARWRARKSEEAA